MRLAKLLILSTCLTGVTTAAQAQSCTTRPSCESLGYDMTTTDCVGKLVLHCPFDYDKIFCGGSTCPTPMTCPAPATCVDDGDCSCVRCETPSRGELFDGRGNTQKIIAQFGADGLAAKACNQFYPASEGVSANDENFGAGKWYLPAMGELIKMYGLSSGSAATSAYGITGADAGKGLTLINSGLTVAGGTFLKSDYYWSSSESRYYDAWMLRMDNGYRNTFMKNDYTYVRCFRLLENCFDFSDSTPKIGDIVYNDKTWSTSFDSTKKPIGVVVDVYGFDVTVVNLKDLTFSQYNSANNFNAASPYTGSYGYTAWSVKTVDITALTNYEDNTTLTAIQAYPYW